MADEIKKEVEGVKSAENASTQSTQSAPTDDPEAKLAALLEENGKLRRDRDNYRAATLAMKGKKDLADLDTSDPTQLQALIQKTVEDELLAKRQESTEGQLESYVKELARKNKELSLALQNKSAVSGGVASGGGGTESKDVQTSYFSPEQKAALETRWSMSGISKEKYPDMLKKAEEAAKLNQR